MDAIKNQEHVYKWVTEESGRYPELHEDPEALENYWLIWRLKGMGASGHWQYVNVSFTWEKKGYLKRMLLSIRQGAVRLLFQPQI